MRVVGLDVWKRGWVAVYLDEGAITYVTTVRSVPELDVDGVDAIGIDIPIVLPQSPGRRADTAAREALGPRRSSVFDALPLGLLEQPTYAAALAECREKFGRGISAQSFALRHRILDARAVAMTDARCIEIHPEVSFMTMARQHIAYAKKTWNGQHLRRHLLAEQGLVIPDSLEHESGNVPVDDLLDAAAAAWSADRYGRGVADPLPSDPADGEAVIWA